MIRCSIVVPVRNHAGLTRRCLDAVLGSVPEQVEVLVVDDGSSDDTPAVVSSFGKRVRLVRMPESGGFAAACNEGVANATGSLIVVLNNDTLPRPGWFEHLVNEADLHTRAGIIGARLLFPNGTVQHAGIVFDQNGTPRHLYTGFPGDHPAVCRSRRLQAVTGACALFRREAFEQAGGFDPAFRNGYEDVDLCLRLGTLGWEIRYCSDAVLEHLESASRGRDTEANDRLYRARWSGRVEPDDLRAYIEDGLLELEYRESYPLRLTVAPLLAGVDGGDVASLLRERTRLSVDLLREVARLTVRLAGEDVPASDGSTAINPSEVEALVQDLQRALGVESEIFRYRRHVARSRAAVEYCVPRGATVVVATHGDDQLLQLGARTAWHFPQNADGRYTGSHPADSAEAIAQLEALRERGANYFLLPQTSSWWLDSYGDFRKHLEQQYRLIMAEDGAALYSMSRSP